MIHDEKTTELEMPGQSNNIVHVNFHGTKRPSQRADAGPLISAEQERSVVRFQSRRRSFDLQSPWLVRVLALLSILFLSLLVL